MSGKANKKIRQQFAREYRAKALEGAQDMLKKHSREMDERREALNDKLFKTRPKLVPVFVWRLLLKAVCNYKELRMQGIKTK